jgi:hypothetical protein
MNAKELALITFMFLLLTCAWFAALEGPLVAQNQQAGICKPRLEQISPIELGRAGLFTWRCPSEEGVGGGYYVVFIRPSGTYVLLKVPEGRTSYEFTPDAVGHWRWLVINTDPDRTKPDVESEPGRFETTPPKDSSN